MSFRDRYPLLYKAVNFIWHAATATGLIFIVLSVCEVLLPHHLYEFLRPHNRISEPEILNNMDSPLPKLDAMAPARTETSLSSSASLKQTSMGLQMDELIKLHALNKEPDLTPEQHLKLSIIESELIESVSRNTGSLSKATAGNKQGVQKQLSEAEQMQKAMDKLKPGNLTFNAPDTMKTAHSARVSAVLHTGSYPDNTIVAALKERPNTSTETDPLRIASRMKMLLESGDFQITPLSSIEQSVGGNEGTSWDWDIVPKRSGTLHLHLVVSVEVGTLAKDLTTADKDITVNVDALDEAKALLKGNLSVVWTAGAAIIAAIAAAGWLKRKSSHS